MASEKFRKIKSAGYVIGGTFMTFLLFLPGILIMLKIMEDHYAAPGLGGLALIPIFAMTVVFFFILSAAMSVKLRVLDDLLKAIVFVWAVMVVVIAFMFLNAKSDEISDVIDYYYQGTL